MTEEEKKALEAAKAEAAKKEAVDLAAKKAAEDKTKEKGKEDPDDDEKDTAGHIKKLKDEAAARRLENKDLKAKVEKFEKALGVITGKTEGNADPIEAQKKASDTKLRNAMLRAAVASAAKDAHDSKLVFSVTDLSKIDVDLENETWDDDAVIEAVSKVRKDKAFLFSTTVADPKKTKVGGKPAPDGSGQPSNGVNHREVWNQLKAQGRTAEAQEYWVKNNKEIMQLLKFG